MLLAMQIHLSVPEMNPVSRSIRSSKFDTCSCGVNNLVAGLSKGQWERAFMDMANFESERCFFIQFCHTMGILTFRTVLLNHS